MLRAVSTIYIESQLLVRRDVLKLCKANAPFGGASYSAAPHSAAPAAQTVLASEVPQPGSAPSAAQQAGPPPPPPPPPPPARRGWSAAAALALTASLGGVYWYRKLTEDTEGRGPAPDGEAGGEGRGEAAGAGEPAPACEPARAEQLPAHAQYLLVGGGTASFAAMRAIRSARPDAQVLIVGEELALPYMRPPLSKELWREPDLAQRALEPESLTFRQWNGKRRSVTYEPRAFYTAAEALSAGGAGAGVARGWRVVRLEPERRTAELRAPDGQQATLTYDKCLVATGSRPRRLAALRGAAGAGRALALRGVRDAARLAARLDDAGVTRVLVVGGGFLASELSAALAERLRGSGRQVVQVFREAAPLAHVLPAHLARDAARRLAAQGVALLPHTEITDSEVRDGCVRMSTRRTGGAGDAADGELQAELVVECVGCAPDEELARASGLELHAELGGLLVNAELQARAGVWAAGDCASYHDVALGRRRVEHHDHAVQAGRLAGENMAALRPPRALTHQSMFWSDLGPHLGYEAIGIIDSKLPTVSVFSADAVKREEPRALAAGAAGEGSERSEGGEAEGEAEGAAAGEAAGQQYERGVVFYLRDERVVGVLLWNLFNRMQVARQVVAQGSFDDLFEVAKLFAPHEED